MAKWHDIKRMELPLVEREVLVLSREKDGTPHYNVARLVWRNQCFLWVILLDPVRWTGVIHPELETEHKLNDFEYWRKLPKGQLPIGYIDKISNR